MCLEVLGGRYGGQVQTAPGALPGVRRAIRGRPGQMSGGPCAFLSGEGRGAGSCRLHPQGGVGSPQGGQRVLRRFWGRVGAGVRSGRWALVLGAKPGLPLG